jgi:Tfp pilus assembly major pilin PilA
MKSLPESVTTEFEKGNFTVLRKDELNGVWTGMALEQTFNKDAKTKLFSGSTQNEAAIAKYLKALPVMSAILEETMRMDHMANNVLSDDSLDSKDAETLGRLTMVIDEKMVNLFRNQTSLNLMNIATGQIATRV